MVDSLSFSEARQLSPKNDSLNHFFGYYSICPWSENQKYYVMLETDFQNHMPKLGETARIILIDLEDGAHKVIGETKAWNFQQGAMLHWLPSAPNDKIIFNDCDGEKPISRILNVHTGQIEKIFTRAINAVAHTKDLALCVSFARLKRNRKVTSYPCTKDNMGINDSLADDINNPNIHPDNEGIWLLDLKTGDSKLIISLDNVWNMNPETADMTQERRENMGIKELWFNHVCFNPNDNRFFFLARFKNWFKSLITSMWTINLDGTDPYLLVDYYKQLSHFEWYDDTHIMTTQNMEIKDNPHNHVMYEDKVGNPQIYAKNRLTLNGHPTFSPDKKLMATDTYVVDGMRYVYVFEMESKKLHIVYSFENPKKVTKELRCDPHPRWNRDGTQLSFDAIVWNDTMKKYSRQVMLLDVIILKDLSLV